MPHTEHPYYPSASQIAGLCSTKYKQEALFRYFVKQGFNVAKALPELLDWETSSEIVWQEANVHKKEAGDRGTSFHDVIYQYILSKEIPEDPVFVRTIEYTKDLIEGKSPLSEVKLVSDKIRLHGTPDLILANEVIDFKTGFVDRHYCTLQLAAYALLWNTEVTSVSFIYHDAEPITVGRIIPISKITGKFGKPYIVKNIEQYFSIVEKLCEVWNFLNSPLR